MAVVHAGIPVYDFLAASSLVCIDNTPLLDPNSQELSCMPPEFLVATHSNLEKVGPGSNPVSSNGA
jgi:ribonuclease PH